jgi:hypothetical protein
MRPDRFEKMAGDITYTRESLALNIAHLLRRQHRAYVRMVKAQGSFGKVSEGGGGEWILRYDLLATLTRYAKGKGKL